MTQSKVILVDVDDTIANTRQAILDYYRLETGDYSTSLERAKSYWYAYDLCPKFTNEEVENAFNDPLLFKLLKPMEGAQEGVAYLQRKGFDIRVCTMHRAEGVILKDTWLNYHFPTIESRYYSTSLRGNKDDFSAYSIIDDNIKNINTSPCDIPILLDFFGIQGNIYRKDDKRIRVNSWKEIIERGIFRNG